MRTKREHEADVDTEIRLIDEYLTWACIPRRTCKVTWGDIACDIYDKDNDMLIEAKTRATAASFHTAVGELLDYSDQDAMQGASLWILTRDEPSVRLQAYALRRNVRCIWQEDREFVIV